MKVKKSFLFNFQGGGEQRQSHSQHEGVSGVGDKQVLAHPAVDVVAPDIPVEAAEVTKFQKLQRLILHK